MKVTPVLQFRRELAGYQLHPGLVVLDRVQLERIGSPELRFNVLAMKVHVFRQRVGEHYRRFSDTELQDCRHTSRENQVMEAD